MTPEATRLFAKYNRTLNERVYDACRELDPTDLAADKGAFFGSILGTLNHIAVADTIWLQRFAKHPARFDELREMSSFPVPTSLRQILASDLANLRAYRERLDSIIELWAPSLTAAHLASVLSYASMAGVKANKTLGAVLLHFFNHQTHHRGQASTLLMQSGVDVGVTDLITLVPDGDA